PSRVLTSRMLPISYSSKAGTCTSSDRLSTSARRRRASFTSSSSRVLIHLMSTEESTTIFAAMPGVPIVADDVRRIPLADPLLLELPEGGQRVSPGTAARATTAGEGTQGLSNQLAPGAVLGLGDLIHLLEEVVG